jgi:hypothetical protein
MPSDDQKDASPESSSAVHVVTPVRSAGWWSLTKLGPIIAAVIIGAATITSALINRSTRNNNNSTSSSRSEPVSTSFGVSDQLETTVVAETVPGPTTVPPTAPPQVIIVQVPASSWSPAPKCDRDSDGVCLCAAYHNETNNQFAFRVFQIGPNDRRSGNRRSDDNNREQRHSNHYPWRYPQQPCSE